MSSIYTGHTCQANYKLAGMSKHTGRRAGPQRQYQRLRRQLARLGPISQGSVQDRTGRQGGGAGYQWTRKLSGKTVTVALTAEQFQRLKVAIGNYRRLRRHLSQMEKLSRRMIFQAAPHRGRLKTLRQRVLAHI
jgi:hypothetical protein